MVAEAVRVEVLDDLAEGAVVDAGADAEGVEDGEVAALVGFAEVVAVLLGAAEEFVGAGAGGEEEDAVVAFEGVPEDVLEEELAGGAGGSEEEGDAAVGESAADEVVEAGDVGFEAFHGWGPPGRWIS